MFDTPDLGPCFSAPFVAAFVAVLIYFIGSVTDTVIEVKRGNDGLGSMYLFVGLLSLHFPLFVLHRPF